MKTTVARLALIGAELSLGIGLCEVILRVIGVGYPLFLGADYYLGQMHRSGKQGWYTAEGHAFVTINSAGFRDRERSRIKPTNVFRIAVLGDSYPEAFQVPFEQSFPQELERDLGKCPALSKQKVEVLNFGVGGYGTAQEMILLRRYVWSYSPDLVLLAFTTGNDLSDNSRTLDPSKMRPFFTLEHGSLRLDNSFRQSFRYKVASSRCWRFLCLISDYSRIIQLLNHVIVGIYHARGGIARNRDPEAGQNEAVYSMPSSKEWIDVWQVTEALLRSVYHETRAHDAQFLLVTMTSDIQVSPEQDSARAIAAHLRVPDLFYPDRRLSALGQREGFPVLDLTRPFEAYAIRNHVFLHGFPNTVMGRGHWNAVGHRLAGELIARRVCEIVSTPAHSQSRPY